MDEDDVGTFTQNRPGQLLAGVRDEKHLDTRNLQQRGAQLTGDHLIRDTEDDSGHLMASGMALPPRLPASKVFVSPARLVPTSSGSATSRTSWANAAA